MRTLQRILDDIRRGENIDLYVTVIVALGVAALNLFGLAQSWIGPITLAVLGLLAVSTLVNRHHIEELLRKVGQSPETVFQEEYPLSLKSDMETATELWLVGVTLHRTIRTYYSLIEQKLLRWQTVKVLLVHPAGAALEMAETRVYERSDVERTRRELLGSLQDLCDLRQKAPDMIELRTIQNPLGFGGVIINPNTASGILYLEHYAFKMKGAQRPKIILRAREGYWYDFFKEEVQTLWNHGVQWTCEQTS